MEFKHDDGDGDGDGTGDGDNDDDDDDDNDDPFFGLFGSSHAVFCITSPVPQPNDQNCLSITAPTYPHRRRRLSSRHTTIFLIIVKIYCSQMSKLK